MMSTSPGVAVGERRTIAYSTTNPSSAPPAMAITIDAHQERPSVRCAVQARNADTISISPWAKLSVRVAL